MLKGLLLLDIRRDYMCMLSIRQGTSNTYHESKVSSKGAFRACSLRCAWSCKASINRWDAVNGYLHRLHLCLLSKREGWNTFKIQRISRYWRRSWQEDSVLMHGQFGILHFQGVLWLCTRTKIRHQLLTCPTLHSRTVKQRGRIDILERFAEACYMSRMCQDASGLNAWKLQCTWSTCYYNRS